MQHRTADRDPATARFATLATVLAIFTTIFASNLPTPLYAVWQAQWQFSATVLTAVFAVYVLGVIATLPTVGPLSDLVGRRQVMIPGLAFIALGGVVFALAQNPYWLAIGRLFTGIGTGVVTGAATAALVELDPAGNRARAATVSALCLTAGATCGPVFSSAALRFMPWPTVLPFVVVTALALAAIGFLLRVRWPRGVGRRQEGFQLRYWRPQRLSVPREIRGGFAFAAAAVALGWSAGSLYGALGPSLAVELVGIQDRALAGLYAAGFQLVGGLGQFALRRRSALSMLTIGPALLAGGMLVSVLGIAFASPPMFTLGTVLTALGGGATSVGSVAMVSMVAPESKRGAVISAFYIVAYLTMASVVLSVGVTSDLIGLKWTMVLLSAVITVAAAALIRACRRLDPSRAAAATSETPASADA